MLAIHDMKTFIHSILPPLLPVGQGEGGFKNLILLLPLRLTTTPKHYNINDDIQKKW